MNREQLLNYLSDLILQRKSQFPLKVAINGIDCSGKTTLANDLKPIIEARGLEVIRASVDDFSLPRSKRYMKGELSPEAYYSDSFDYASLKQYLLEPFLEHSFPLKFSLTSFDLRRDAPAFTKNSLFTEDAVLLFEGVFLFRPEINHYWDYRIFLDISFETSLARALNRDLPLFQSVERVATKYKQRYIPGQRLYLDQISPKSLADVVIDNNDPQVPKIATFSAQDHSEKIYAGDA